MTTRSRTMLSDARPKWARSRRGLRPYILILPAFALLGFTVGWPLLRAVSISVTDYILIKPDSGAFVGFQNFSRALGDEQFWASLLRTAIWTVSVIVGSLALGTLIALFLSRDFKGCGLVRVAALVPWTLPTAVNSLVWTWLFHGSKGVINDLLIRTGILNRPIEWLGDPSRAFVAVIVSMIWRGVPFFAVMILAALQAISPAIIDAARVDGANRVQAFFRVKLPIIMPAILTFTLMRTIWVSTHLDMLYMMTGGGPGYRTTTLPLYVFRETWVGFKLGYGSALSLLMAVILLFMSVLYLLRLGRTEARFR